MILLSYTKKTKEDNMEPLSCSNCGSTNFTKNRNIYTCSYCASVQIQKSQYIKRLIFILIVVLLFATYIFYSKFNHLETTIIQSKETNIKEPKLYENNPFQKLIVRVKYSAGEPLLDNSLETILTHYYSLANPKALYIILLKTGQHVVGFSQKETLKKAKENAYKLCMMEAEGLIKEKKYSCVPYIINNLIVRDIVLD